MEKIHKCSISGSAPTSGGGRIHLNLVAVWLKPTIHCVRQSAFSLLKTTFMFSSLTRFFHVFFGLPVFLEEVFIYFPCGGICTVLCFTYMASLDVWLAFAILCGSSYVGWKDVERGVLFTVGNKSMSVT